MSEPSLSMRDADAMDMVRWAWLDRRVIIKGGLGGLVASILFVLMAVPHYRATMLIAPVTRSATTDLSGPLPENAGYGTEYMLKSFAAGDTADFTSFEQILRQPRVAGILLQDAAVRQGVLQDRSFRLSRHTTLRDAQDLAGYLQDHITIEPVGSTPLRRVSYDHPDRVFAETMLQKIYDAADRMMRDDMRLRADKRIAWLQGTIATTQNPDDQRAMAALLTAQQQMRLALTMDEPYAARMTEPPSAGSRRVWPRAPLIVPVFVFAGAILGAIVAAGRRAAAAR